MIALLALLGLLGLLAAGPALGAQKTGKKVAPVNVSRGAAIHGYDPVAYFEQQRPVKGDKAYVHEWNGAVWRFSSVQNRERFAADPDRYAPQYGGYCAYAVSEGYTANIDPDAFTLRDGKLYLNYDLDVQETWRAEAEERIGRADETWPKLRRQP